MFIVLVLLVRVPRDETRTEDGAARDGVDRWPTVLEDDFGFTFVEFAAILRATDPSGIQESHSPDVRNP
jgi:hypothetical protein